MGLLIPIQGPDDLRLFFVERKYFSGKTPGCFPLLSSQNPFSSITGRHSHGAQSSLDSCLPSRALSSTLHTHCIPYDPSFPSCDVIPRGALLFLPLPLSLWTLRPTAPILPSAPTGFGVEELLQLPKEIPLSGEWPLSQVLSPQLPVANFPTSYNLSGALGQPFYGLTSKSSGGLF